MLLSWQTQPSSGRSVLETVKPREATTFPPSRAQDGQRPDWKSSAPFPTCFSPRIDARNWAVGYHKQNNVSPPVRVSAACAGLQGSGPLLPLTTAIVRLAREDFEPRSVSAPGPRLAQPSTQPHRALVLHASRAGRCNTMDSRRCLGPRCLSGAEIAGSRPGGVRVYSSRGGMMI